MTNVVEKSLQPVTTGIIRWQTD